MEIAGITILIAFFGSVLLMSTSPFDSDQRGAAFSALAAASLLEFVWVLAAAIFAVLRWAETSTKFRAIFVANIIIVLLLALNFYRH